MREIRMIGVSAAMLALAGAAAFETGPSEPGAHGSARNKPSGNKPVAGGGAKERARRLARMTCADCGAHIGNCQCENT